MRLAAGLCPDPLGELKRSPRPPSRKKGPTSKGGREGREEEGRERGKEGEGRGGRGRAPPTTSYHFNHWVHQPSAHAGRRWNWPLKRAIQSISTSCRVHKLTQFNGLVSFETVRRVCFDVAMCRLLQKRQTDKLCEAYSLTVDKVNKKSCCWCKSPVVHETKTEPIGKRKPPPKQPLIRSTWRPLVCVFSNCYWNRDQQPLPLPISHW